MGLGMEENDILFISLLVADISKGYELSLYKS